MVSVDAHTSRQQVLQAMKGAHDGESLLIHGRPPLLRAQSAAQKPKRVMASLSTSTPPSIKLSLWDLRQEKPPMVVRSIGKDQYASFGCDEANSVGHQVLCIASRSHLLALPCFLHDQPI